MVDPQSAGDAYHFCSGFRSNGEPWPDPTNEYLPTPYPFAGDPVRGTGWLLSSLRTPCDVKMGISSGPFKLAVGDSQDVVVAVMVGNGIGNLAPLTALRHNARMAKTAYDMGFELRTDLKPKVEAIPLDGRIALTWDDEAVDFSSHGYEFEGYNIWQGESSEGPWTRLATFDKINGIGWIRDYVFNASIGEMVEQTVAYGTDSGISYEYLVDKDSLNNQALVNMTEYNFAVTAYVCDLDGIPRVIESEPSVVTVVPCKPGFDVQWRAAYGDTVAVQHTGPSQGQVVVRVVDPSVLTGDDYRVSFTTISSGTDTGTLAWKLTDVTKGLDLLVDQTQQAVEEGFLVADGMEVIVLNSIGRIRDIVQADSLGNILDDNLHNDLNWEVDREAGKCAFYCFTPWESGDSWILRMNFRGNIGFEEYEIRFVNDPETEGQILVNEFAWDPPFTYQGYQSGPVGATGNDTPEYTMTTPGRMPFQVWMIERDGTETQVDATFHDDNMNSCWDLSDAYEGIWSPEGYSFERIYATNHPYDEAQILSDDGQYVADQVLREDSCNTLSSLAIGMFRDNFDSNPSGNFFTEPPAPGTIIRVRTKLLNSEQDVFEFSTADYKPVRNAEVAKSRLNEIGVFPNPYFGGHSGEGGSMAQFVTFNNLPAECVIRVFSLSGQMVRTIQHQNETPLERWDLLNDHGTAIGSGMFIVHVETAYGNKILKMAVINRE